MCANGEIRVSDLSCCFNQSVKVFFCLDLIKLMAWANQSVISWYCYSWHWNIFISIKCCVEQHNKKVLQFDCSLATYVSNHTPVIAPPPNFLHVCVVLRITVCHAVKLMPTGCLHMMGCVRPPKRTAGGPTEMRVYRMGRFSVSGCICGRKSER